MESKNQILHDFIDWYNEHHPENYIPNSRLGNYLQSCEGKADSTSEKDLRVCEVIASAWISVKERLPEFNTLVLVNCSIYGRFLASYEFIGEFQGVKYGNWKHNDELGILPPTHWMSIPELPK